MPDPTTLTARILAWALLAMAVLIGVAALFDGFTGVVYGFLGAVICAGTYVIGRRLTSPAIWIGSIVVGCANALHILLAFVGR